VGLSRAVDREYYAPATSTARREALKARCMGAGSGVRWAKAYLARGFPDRYTPVLAMFRELERALASGPVASVHQVACCSGREIAYYARRHPRVAFRGSDGDGDVVDFLRETWRELPNLSFARVRLEREEPAETDALRSDLLYASGGFHYLDEPSLRTFLARARGLTSHLLLSQPLDRDFVLDAHAHATPRTQLSWNHPYAHYLRETGWVGVEAEEGLVEELPWVKNVAVWARAR
jgi:trans-aconitate methyltransferase